MAEYSVWVVEYARVKEYPVGGALYGRCNEGHMPFPYCYGVIEGEGHLAVVDTGYDCVGNGKAFAELCNVTDWQPPHVVLGRLGIDPAEVDTVILTHNHFDHAGGTEFFPKAHFYIQEREVSKYLWAACLPDRYQWLTTGCDPDLMVLLSHYIKQGRLTLVQGNLEIMPGVEVVAAHDTHTAGSQYVTIENAHDGRWLMAGDNVYVYENLLGMDGDGRYVPIGLMFGSLERCILTMEDMRQYVGGEITRVLPFHEANLWKHYPGCLFSDGLHVAEISLRPGASSRIEGAAYHD